MKYNFRYLTTTEWSTLYGGKRPGRNTQDPDLKDFRRLPIGNVLSV